MSHSEISHEDQQRQENELRLSESQVSKYERIIQAATVMTQDEKQELNRWEKENVTGDGNFGTSDWPGWGDVISRISH